MNNWNTQSPIEIASRYALILFKALLNQTNLSFQAGLDWSPTEQG